MITYGLCQRTTGYEKIQKNDLWLLSMFEDRHQNGYANVAWIARKSKVLIKETIHSLSTPVYCRDLDRTTLRELIDSEDRLIPDIPVDDVQRVAAQRAPRVQRASMQDLYERMGSMEIRQEAIERMEYRQSYHWDRYQGVFEHMAGVYNVPLQGAYNPPGYAQPQYDQYYQQYYPQQPPQQQHDDEEDETKSRRKGLNVQEIWLNTTNTRQKKDLEYGPLKSEGKLLKHINYLINSLRFVSAKESTQIYRVILPECLTSLVMKESKSYKTYLGYATCAVPPKMARKFKKASLSKKDSVVIREDHVETKSKSKEKEKVDVTRGKGIDLLFEVALTEETQMKEVRKKSLRDFHKTHLSGSGMISEKPQSVDKITPTVTSEGTGDKPGVPYVTEDDSTKSESESWGNDEDDNNNEQKSSNEGSEQETESDEQESDLEQEEESEDDDQEEEEFVHTPTNDKDDDNLESESDDVIKSDEEKGMNDTTYQFDDDVDARLKEPTQTDKEVVQGEGADAKMNDVQQRNENLETTQEQVVEDAHVTISTITKKTEVPVTNSSRSSDLASKFLNFSDIPHSDAEIVSPLDVHVHHEVPRTQEPTLLIIPVSVITESSPVYTNIPQSTQTFTPPPILIAPNPPSTIETTNPLSTLLDFASVFRFNDRITTLEKEVVKLKKDPLHSQVTTLVDEHLDTRLGETIKEFMKFLSESLTTRIKEQVKDQLPQILPKEVSNFAPPVIEKLIKESRDEVTLAKVSSQPHSTYEAASTLTEFELKKILIDKMEKSESYLAAPEHRDCYDSLKKSYDLDKDFFFSYDVYSLKRGRKDKDKDEDPSAGSDRGLKKRKTSKDAEPTTCPKNKDSTSSSSKGTKSQPKPSGKSVQSEEPVFLVADSDMPQDQEGNPGDNDDEPRKEDASRRDWFKKPTPPQEPTDPDWHEGKTPQKGPTQKWLMTLAASTSTDKSLKDFDELMSTPIDFSGYILNGLKIKNLTQEILLGPAFRLLKGTRSNYAELEYDFEECYRLFIYLQGGVSTMTYTTSTTKTKAAQYDLPGIEDMVPNIWSLVKVAYDKYALWVMAPVNHVLSSSRPYKNIDMEYLPKRRWSTLEKKRVNFMIKDINKLLKERRMMRSLEKFIGGRLYRTDLRLLQRTI
ncbi:hypothetical protein Tco_0554726 [Tanacetum coccineum]